VCGTTYQKELLERRLHANVKRSLQDPNNPLFDRRFPPDVKIKTEPEMPSAPNPGDDPPPSGAAEDADPPVDLLGKQ